MKRTQPSIPSFLNAAEAEHHPEHHHARAGFTWLLAALLLAPAAMQAQDFTCTTNDGSITITGYTGSGGELTIPATIGDLPVVCIGPRAFYFHDSLTGVVIPHSVISIEDEAFAWCRNLTSVTLGNGVTTIGSAFRDCPALSSVTLGSSLTNIGSFAFSGCTSLSGVLIGNTVARIGENAFHYCTNLTDLTIPESVISIGENAFLYCPSLGAITVAALNPAYSSAGGVLFDKAQATLLCYPAAKTDSSYAIPASVVEIKDYAFVACEQLTSIAIGRNVASLGAPPFYAGPLLTNISVSPLNSSYSSSDGVLFDKHRTVLIECPAGKTGSYSIPESVTNIAIQAFRACPGLTNVSIPNGVISVGYWAFSDCTGLTSVTIPGSVTRLGGGAFQNCGGLSNLTLPTGLTSIEFDLCADCSRLTSILIPDAVTNIDNRAFSGCTSLTNITLGDCLTGIQVMAFWRCAALKSVTLPDSLTRIGDWAFAECADLEAIALPDNVTNIGMYAFSGCGLTNVIFGKGVRSIGGGAFSSCAGLSRVDIPDGLTEISQGCFAGCTGLEIVVIPESVTSLETGAFNHCSRLPEIIIPNSVRTIGNSAFYSCTGLTNVTLGNSVTNIQNNAFDSCTGLTVITIPDSVLDLGDAFDSCTSLETVIIGRSVSRIGASLLGVFVNCPCLTTIAVDPQNAVFSSLDGVLFDKGQTTLIRYPEGKTGGYTIPDTVTAIETSAFEHCANLTDILIPDSVRNLGFRAFADCASVTNVILGSGITNVEGYAFGNCANLIGVYSRGDAPSAWLAFQGESSATVYYLPGTAGWNATFGGRPTAPWWLPNPLILSRGSGFGVKSGGFGFVISWATNTSLTVEACTNLARPDWQPLLSGTLTNGSLYFSDPDWANHPARLYRIRSP